VHSTHQETRKCYTYSGRGRGDLMVYNSHDDE
jgi:hypothetical protein